jgi:SAM-dependent methyltransferase
LASSAHGTTWERNVVTGDLDSVGARYWEDFYREGRANWSGNPNAVLVAEVADLDPGTALDLGCGQGDDAIWLARRGWRVTAVDVSATALARAAERAAAAGVTQAITHERHDLGATFPAGTFDLVVACYLHSPVELAREQILGRAAAAVAPGGTLLVVGHAGFPPWVEHDHSVHFPTPDEVLDDLALAAGVWEVERCTLVDRPITDPDGNPATRPDNVLRIRRVQS